MITRLSENGWSLFGPHRRRSLQQAGEARAATRVARELSRTVGLRISRDTVLSMWRSVRGPRHGVTDDS